MAVRRVVLTNSSRSSSSAAAIQIEHIPPYLSVLFNAQQRSDVSCARFLKCTIIPFLILLQPPLPRLSPRTWSSWHQKGCMYNPFVRIREETQNATGWGRGAVAGRGRGGRAFHLIAARVIFITLLLVIVIQYVLLLASRWLLLLLPAWCCASWTTRDETNQRIGSSHGGAFNFPASF